MSETNLESNRKISFTIVTENSAIRRSLRLNTSESNRLRRNSMADRGTRSRRTRRRLNPIPSLHHFFNFNFSCDRSMRSICFFRWDQFVEQKSQVLIGVLRFNVELENTERDFQLQPPNFWFPTFVLVFLFSCFHFLFLFRKPRLCY